MNVKPCRTQCECHPLPETGERSGTQSRCCTSGYGNEGWPPGTDLERTKSGEIVIKVIDSTDNSNITGGAAPTRVGNMVV